MDEKSLENENQDVEECDAAEKTEDIKQSYTDSLNELRASYDAKLAAVKSDYEAKLHEREAVINQLLTAEKDETEIITPANEMLEKINARRARAKF